MAMAHVPLHSAHPAVSIILPTYNRARFLPAAFEAIRAQTFADWELVVIDDGSTDETRDLVAELVRGMGGPIRYIFQENRGAYAARNTGLDLARGDYIAFFDSDDVWLPHHLKNCVEALEAHPDLDWVYGACRMTDHATGRCLSPNTFYQDESPRPFLGLHAREADALRILDDPGVIRCALRHGLYCGLQNSVIRSTVFETERFRVHPRNEGEDQVFVIRVLAAGHRLAYFNAVHAEYHVHEANSSAAGASGDQARRERVVRELIAGYEALRREIVLSSADARDLRLRISRLYFWMLGYQLWESNRDRSQAIAMYRKALELWPWDFRYWKTYLLALVKRAVADRRPGHAP